MAEAAEALIHFPLWERQDFESDEQWAAFAHYRNTPPAVRSMARTGAEMYVKRGRLHEWSVALHWDERARDFDRWMDRELANQLSRSEAIHEVRRAHLRLLNLFSGVLGDEIEVLLKQQAQRRAEGGTYSILKPHEISRALRDTVILSRLLMGESTENVAVGANLKNLSDEELKALDDITGKLDGKPSILTRGRETKD